MTDYIRSAFTINGYDDETGKPEYGPRFSNARALADANALGYVGEPGDHVLDMTYGKGNFWSEFRPENLTGVDVVAEKSPGGPLWTPGEPLDFRSAPSVFGVDRFAATTLDVPYKLQGASHLTKMNDAYGVDREFEPTSRIFSLFESGVRVAAAVTAPDGHLLIKMQDQTNGGERRRLTFMIHDWLPEWKHHDDLIVFGWRKQPDDLIQRRSHQDFSVLQVWKMK